MKKLKILVLNAKNTYNYGSMMMAINIIKELNKKLYAKFICEFENDDDLKRLQKETNIKSIDRMQFNNNIQGTSFSRFIKRYNYIYKERFSIIRKKGYNAIIILGGDDLSEYYEKRKIYILFHLYFIFKLAKITNLFLTGQTIGPYFSWRKLSAKYLLKNCNIYTRDSHCTNYLKNELKLENVTESSDLAFLDLPNKPRNISYANENEYITLVPSGLTKHYTKFEGVYIDTWIRIIIDLLYKKQIEKIVLLAHVSKPKKGSDSHIINKVVHKLDKKTKEKIIVKSNNMLPSEARAILGGGLMTITGRMHAAISTFQQGKPAISLSYSVKYGGIIGADLGRDDLIIECKDRDLFENGEIVDLVDKKVDYVMKNYNKLTKEIKQGVKRLEKKAYSQIEDIARILNEKN